MDRIASDSSRPRRSGTPGACDSSHLDSQPLIHSTILVIEDDREARESLRRVLEVLGARVLVAENGIDGLERLAGARVDAALCDLTMPVMDGLEFARRVRRTPRLRNLLLVAVTGRQEHQDFLRSWDAGFDAHLVKPVTTEMLLSIARRLAARCADQHRAGA